MNYWFKGIREKVMKTLLERDEIKVELVGRRAHIGEHCEQLVSINVATVRSMIGQMAKPILVITIDGEETRIEL